MHKECKTIDCCVLQSIMRGNVHRSLVITEMGTSGRTSFTCCAIRVTRESSATEFAPRKPCATVRGLAPKSRSKNDLISHFENEVLMSQYLNCNSDQINTSWFNFSPSSPCLLECAVWGTTCLLLLMCSALSALVICVEITPSSVARSWERDTMDITHQTMYQKESDSFELDKKNRSEGEVDEKPCQ